MPTLSIIGTKQKIAALLKAGGIEDPAREAAYILSHALNQPRAQLLALDDIDAPDDVILKIDEMARRRAAREPLARIFGVKEFWGLPFGLNDHTLVPRSDTETLVSAVLDRLPDRSVDYRILDLGTGTGCVLLSLLYEYRTATGIGVDIAPEAVAQAQKNAVALKMGGRAELRHSDWFDNVKGDFDIIVSNPPYIATGEIFTLQPEVRKHDPHLALFAGDEGLDAYRILIPQALKRLKAGGLLAVEIGRGQELAVSALFEQAGFTALGQQADLGGIIRVIYGQMPHIS